MSVPNSSKDHTIKTENFTQEKKEQQEKTAFSKYIKECQKKYQDAKGQNIKMSRRELAEKVGIDYEMFCKKVNKEKPTNKRDFIIAIGIALRLSVGEINTCFDKYDMDMPYLNEKDPRDKEIIERISSENKTTIEELNECLKFFDFSPLDIHDERGKGVEKDDSKKVSFEMIDSGVRSSIWYNPYHGNPHNSLSTDYDLSSYKFGGFMEIIESNNPSAVPIRLRIDNEGKMYAVPLKTTPDDINLSPLDLLDPKRREAGQEIQFESIEQTGEYKSAFIKINDKINRHKSSIFDILKDTRNYKERTSARLVDDKVMVFTEEYSYSYPQLGEYYNVIFTSGRYKFNVFDESAFMYYYLPEEDYIKYYHKIPKAIASYNSIEEIKKEEQRKDYTETQRNICEVRWKAFSKLVDKVNDLHEKILKKEKFIQNAKDIYSDNWASLYDYYNVADDFKIERDCDDGIITQESEKEYTLPDNKTVVIKSEDIQRAFELGYKNIEQICRIKSKYGSLENVLM